MPEFFHCHAHGVTLPIGDYAAHNRDEHDGSSPCVLMLTAAEVALMLNEGMSAFEASQVKHADRDLPGVPGSFHPAAPLDEVEAVYALEAQYAEQEPADEWPDPTTRTLPLREEPHTFDFTGDALRCEGLLVGPELTVVQHGAFMCAQYVRPDGKQFSVSGAIGAYSSNRGNEAGWTETPHKVEVAVFPSANDCTHEFQQGWCTPRQVVRLFDRFVAGEALTHQEDF